MHRIRAGDRNAPRSSSPGTAPGCGEGSGRNSGRACGGCSIRRTSYRTLSRRLDSFVRDKRLNVENEAQLWAFVQKMADNATIDKGRLLKRLRTAEADDSRFAQEFLRRIEDAESREREGGELVIERALTLTERPDRPPDSVAVARGDAAHGDGGVRGAELLRCGSDGR